jgi:CRISPR/Cas system CSM-associated protein Csm2 small subunit
MKLQEGAIKINPMFNNDIMGVPIYKAVQRDLLPGEEKWKQKVRTSRAKRHAAMLGITEDQISKVRMLYNTIQAKESKKKETEWRKILAQRTNDESSIDKS